MDVTQLLTRLYGDEGRQGPYPCYAALHRLGPVSPVPARAGHRSVAAVAVGYDLVSQVLRDPRWYKQAPPGWREQEVLRTLQTSMMFVNPPEHTRMRAVFARIAGAPTYSGSLFLRAVDKLTVHPRGGPA